MTGQKADADYEWLEEVEGEEALAWVEQISAKTLATFEASPPFDDYQAAALEILEADDRIAFGVIRGDQVYNFWQDAEHVRGLWRRVDRAGYEAADPEWEIVLDLDALAAAEDANHVWKGGGGQRRLHQGSAHAVRRRQGCRHRSRVRPGGR